MRKPENKRIDEIGKMLVKAGTMPSRDIEKIIANPQLFEGVRQRIALADVERPARRRSILRPAAAMAGLIFVAAAAIAIVSLRSGDLTQIVSGPQTPAPVNQEQVKQEPVRKSMEPDRIVDTGIRPVDTMSRSERISSRTTDVRTPRPKRSATPQQIRFVDDFYAVSYAGDPHETERGGRIVRVDIPRSTLFAMGINVPLENESATVKADLLIGNDGVTRGIRIVE